MFIFSYPESPLFSGTSVVTVLSTEPITSVRNAKAPNGSIRAKADLKRTEPCAQLPAVVHVPVTEAWGTTLIVVKTPEVLGGHPIPLCHRAGSTLWISPSESYVCGRHVVEAVAGGQWYLVGSHTSTDHIWWDLADWGGSMATTLAVEKSLGTDDCGLIVVAHTGQVGIERAVTYARTFGHDDTLRFAESRQLPDEPTSDWNFAPRKIVIDDSGVGHVFDQLGRNPAAQLYATIGSTFSAKASTKHRRTVSAISPSPVPNAATATSLLHLVTYTASGSLDGLKVISARTSSKQRTTTDLTIVNAPESDSSPSVSLMQQHQTRNTGLAGQGTLSP